MKAQKIFSVIAIACLVLTGCKTEQKAKEVKTEKVSLAISGMTCEIGCAKTIQSKLSKKEGVLDAKVIFTDSIANIEYDANKTSTKDLIAFVDGIAGGEMYKATKSTNANKKAHTCTEDCKEKCEEMTADKKECKENCTMACCADKKA